MGIPMKTLQLDTASVVSRARKMTDAALRYSRKDANEAAEAAEGLAKAGCRVIKDGGYYRDEACVYAAELRRRGVE